MTQHTEQPERSRQRQPGTVVVGVMLLLIAIVTVYAARQRPRPSAVSVNDETQLPATDDKARREAAHVLACTSIDMVIDSPMVFDRVFRIEDVEDGSSRLTTAALLNGRKVDVSAVLQWDEASGAWDVLEAYVGGAAVTVKRSADRKQNSPPAN